MPWKDNNKVWFTPVYVHDRCIKLVQNKGIEQIKKDKNFKKLIESLDLSILALTLYDLNKNTHELPLIQIPKNDPPDGYVGQESKFEKGEFDLSVIELTRYDGKNGKSLLEQLKESGKIGTEYNKYGKEYVLVIKVEEGISPDYIEINNFLKDNSIPYAVWALQIIQSHPDTMTKLIILNPEIQIIHTNIGEISFEYNKQKIPDVQEINRVGSKDKVRKEITNLIDPKYLNPEFGWILD